MPQNPTLEEWRLLTLRLRIAGWSYREIATRVGVSPTQVFRDIGRVCDLTRATGGDILPGSVRCCPPTPGYPSFVASTWTTRRRER